MLTDEMRKQVMISHEGQILAVAGQCGIPHACDMAHCVVDGMFNALIRMEGREKAAEVAFAVSDRVAGGLREGTVWPMVKQENIPLPSPPAQVTVISAPTKWPRVKIGFILLTSVGFGCLLGAVVEMWLFK
jgi:hypothetical protein